MTTARPTTVAQAEAQTGPGQMPWWPYLNPKTNPANWITIAAFACGLCMIWLAARALIGWAIITMIMASVFDLTDGTVARFMGTDKNLPYAVGHYLDGFSDSAWAGAGAGFIMYYAQLQKLGFIGFAVIVVWAICALLRLVRYTITRPMDKRVFVGCPAPAAAWLAMAATLTHPPVWVTVAVSLLLSAAMVSKRQIPNWLAQWGPTVSSQAVFWASWLLVSAKLKKVSAE